MNLNLTQHEGVPLYLQIIKQIKQLITAGRLVEDQELLAIRVLAEKLLINPNTVARAYRELEANGWVYKKRGAGTFVAKQNSPLSADSCQQQIQERVNALLAEARHMKFPTKEIIRLLKEADDSID